jgi:integron integrase
MADGSSKELLGGFEDFLRSRKLVQEQNIPYYAQWVHRFVSFSDQTEEADQDGLVEKFVASLKSRQTLSDWQVSRLEEAVRLYLGPYLHGVNAPEFPSLGDREIIVSEIPLLVEEMKRVIKMKHYAYSTERSYIDWVKRFAAYVGETKKADGIEPAMTSDDAMNFLSHLAIKEKVSGSTQKQALNALLFLFREVLHGNLSDTSGRTAPARRTKKLPVILSADEVKNLFKQLSGTHLLIAKLMYGAGLRLMEAARLRVDDIDFDRNRILVRSETGKEDRTTILPYSVKDELRVHLEEVRRLHAKDLAQGYGTVRLSETLTPEDPEDSRKWGWQYIFPSSRLSVDSVRGKILRRHITDKAIQFAVGKAVRNAGIARQATVQTLRHTFATHLLMKGANIRQVQNLMGHRSQDTTMIYMRLLRDMKSVPQSPLDTL